jgi:hypothetical protein
MRPLPGPGVFGFTPLLHRTDLSLLGWRDEVESGVGPEHLWYNNGAVFLLVVLYNGDDYSRHVRPEPFSVWMNSGRPP